MIYGYSLLPCQYRTLRRLCNAKPNPNSEISALACDEGRRLHNGKRQGHRVRCSQLHRGGAGPHAASLLLPLVLRQVGVHPRRSPCIPGVTDSLMDGAVWD